MSSPYYLTLQLREISSAVDGFLGDVGARCAISLHARFSVLSRYTRLLNDLHTFLSDKVGTLQVIGLLICVRAIIAVINT